MKHYWIGFFAGFLANPAAIVTVALLGKADVTWNGHHIKPWIGTEQVQPAKEDK